MIPQLIINFTIVICIFSMVIISPDSSQADDSKKKDARQAQTVKRKMKELKLKPGKMSEAIGLKLTVIPERTKVGPMEPVYLKLHIKSSNKKIVSWEGMQHAKNSLDNFNFIVIDRMGRQAPLTFWGRERIRGVGSSWDHGVQPGKTWETSILINKYYDLTWGAPYTFIVWKTITPVPLLVPGQKFSEKEYRMVSEPVTIHISDEYANPCFRKKKKEKAKKKDVLKPLPVKKK